MSLDDFRRSYEIAPIIFVGGVAQNMTGGKIPVTSFTESGSFSDGPTDSANSQQSLDGYFAHFYPEAGSTLVDNEIAHWPFANQAVAANAVITKPLRLSMIMVCPADGVDTTLDDKQSIITSLQGTIQQHITQGGWFDVATPAFLYQGLLLISIDDVSEYDEDGSQVQNKYRWTFEQPIITQQQAQAAYNTSMGKIASGTQVSGDPPGSNPAASAVGQPSSNVAQNVIPAAANTTGANVTPPGGPTPPPGR